MPRQKPEAEKKGFKEGKVMPLIDYWKILRPKNCAIASFGAFIGYCLTHGIMAFNPLIGLGMATVFIICGAGQAINDYFDLQIDRKIKPQRPLAAGRMKPENAYYFAVALFVLGIILSAFINYTALAIAVVFSFLLYAYSAFLGKYKFIGNWVVASGTAFTLVFGSAVARNYFFYFFLPKGTILLGRPAAEAFFLPLVLAFAALFANAAREIIKDSEDLSGDKGKKKTLPQMVSRKTVKAVVASLYSMTIVAALIPLFLGIFSNVFYLSLVSLSILAFIYSFILLLKNSLHKSQISSKAGMFLGLTAFLLGLI